MGYLTEEEKKMPLDMQLGQYVLGLESCRTKGDAIEILKEIYNAGKEVAKYKPKKRWLTFKDVSNPKNKTEYHLVFNEVCNIGDIRWQNGWRQYVFDDGELLLAEGCLVEILEKIRELRLKREMEGKNGTKEKKKE